MDFEGLATFVLLAKHGSGAQVAKLQGLSQAAVSQRISRIESAYGLRLFIRLGEGMVLTDDGARLLDEAQRILMQLQHMSLQLTQEIRNHQGCIKMFIDRSMSGDRISRQLAELGKIEVIRDLPMGDWQRALSEGEVDLALHASCGPAMEFEGLCRFELKMEAGVTLAWNPESFPFAPKVGLAQLLREVLIVPSTRLIPGFERFFDLVGARSLVPCDLVTVEMESEADARDACLNGIGVLFFPGNAEKRLRLEPSQLECRVTMEFAMPRAYALGLYARDSESRPQVMQVVRDFLQRGAKRPANPEPSGAELFL